MGIFDNIRRNVRRKRILKAIAQLQRTTVDQIMTTYVIAVKLDDDLIKAATKMIAEDISCLVVTEEEKPVGVLSERDFLRKVPMTKEVFSMKVRDVMHSPVTTIEPSMTLPAAVKTMKEQNIRRLIVMRDGKIAGIVTQTDFTRMLSKLFSSYPVSPELTVEHIMHKDILTVNPDQTLVDAKEKMSKANVGCVLIVKDNQPLGIFTEYDCVMQFYDQRIKLEPKDIGSYMRKYVRAVPPQTSIFEANRLMLEKNMRRLLIVDEQKKMLGIVTQTDICRYAYGILDAIANVTEKPDTVLKRFWIGHEVTGEFREEHLKVYTAS
jgi:CBS domain-containing protein